MPISIHDIDLRVMNMRARMPFRYGIVTMTALPHLFVCADVEVDGKPQTGIAADHLPPKWFTKDPQTHFRDDLRQMIEVIRTACSNSVAAGTCPSVFELWNSTYSSQAQWAASRQIPPLLAGFGVSLVERAVIDAACRAWEMPFWQAIRNNRFQIKLDALYREHAPGVADVPSAMNPGDLLPAAPVRKIIARHTVGLTDPLTDADISPADRVKDGLPQSLERCIEAYGLTNFKIKLCGDVDRDLERLERLANLIEARVGSSYSFTLDGNENFKSLQPFQALWAALSARTSLKKFLNHLFFVEQPLHRDVALSTAVKHAMQEWPDRPPLIIDESEATVASLPQALDCGYIGTSHKNCKGVIKSVANACLLESRRRRDGVRYIHSGEDLSNVGPVALLQDMAVAASLGIANLERNGHHYFAGLSMFPAELQETVLKQHPDLYRRHPDGFATLRIEQGSCELQTILEAPFGRDFEVDCSTLTRLEDWKFESLGLQ